MLIQQLTKIPELRTHQKTDRIGVWCFSIHIKKEFHRLFRFFFHQFMQHGFNRTAIAAAEK